MATHLLLRRLLNPVILCSHAFAGPWWMFLLRLQSALACLCQDQTYFKLLESSCLPIFRIITKSLLGYLHQLWAGHVTYLVRGTEIFCIAWHLHGGLPNYFYIALDGSASLCWLNFYSYWRRYLICVAIGGTVASFRLNLYGAWRRYYFFMYLDVALQFL